MPRVLVVEDDEPFAAALRWRFSRAGYEVALVATQAEAFPTLRTGNFAAIVLDLHLPDASGRPLYEDICYRAAGAVVVPMTAWPLAACNVPGVIGKSDTDVLLAVVARRLAVTLDRLTETLQVRTVEVAEAAR